MVDGTSPNARFLADDSRSKSHKPRIAGALSASLFSHLAGLLIIGWLTSLRPVGDVAATPKSDATTHIVWLEQPGPGRGGGGGGGATPRPPRRAELVGKSTLTVPVTRPASFEPKPAQEQPAPPEQQIVIPALTMAAGLQEIVGIVSEAPSVPASSLGPGSGRGAGAGRGPGSGDGDGDGLNDGRNGGTDGDVYKPGTGTIPPQLVRDIKPIYTAEAMRARVQGLVTMQAIVLADGSVGPTRILRSLDAIFGLDQEALRTVKQWRFVPGRRGGKPVAVMVEIEMMFTLR